MKRLGRGLLAHVNGSCRNGLSDHLFSSVLNSMEDARIFREWAGWHGLYHKLRFSASPDLYTRYLTE